MSTSIKLGALLQLALLTTACGTDGDDSRPPKKPGTTFTQDAASVETPSDAGAEDAAEIAGDPCVATRAEADQEGWAEGCYKCKPTKNEEFLNSCAKGFRVFDTKAYPTSWKPNALPPLP